MILVIALEKGWFFENFTFGLMMVMTPKQLATSAAKIWIRPRDKSRPAHNKRTKVHTKCILLTLFYICCISCYSKFCSKSPVRHSQFPQPTWEPDQVSHKLWHNEHCTKTKKVRSFVDTGLLIECVSCVQNPLLPRIGQNFWRAHWWDLEQGNEKAGVRQHFAECESTWETQPTYL